MTSLSKCIWAERRMGEMLQEQEMYKGGGDSSTGSRVRLVQAPPTLADVGITKSMSSRAHKIASVPEEEFETVIEEHKHAEKELTSATTQRLVATSNPTTSAICCCVWQDITRSHM